MCVLDYTVVYPLYVALPMEIEGLIAANMV